MHRLSGWAATSPSGLTHLVLRERQKSQLCGRCREDGPRKRAFLSHCSSQRSLLGATHLPLDLPARIVHQWPSIGQCGDHVIVGNARIALPQSVHDGYELAGSARPTRWKAKLPCDGHRLFRNGLEERGCESSRRAYVAGAERVQRRKVTR